MPEKKRTKKRGSRRELRERRFAPEPMHTTWTSVGLGMVGSLVLGAGVYAQWVTEPSGAYAPYLVGVGAFSLAGSMWLGSASLHPVRVGDTGIAVERGSELHRIAWCDVERIQLEKKNVIVRSSAQTLSIPISGHPKAAAWILEEARRRMPGTVDVPESASNELPKTADGDGELLPLESVQVTGRRCASSDKVIAFERDARLCPSCGQVYHRDHVPARCATCEAELSGRTLQP